MTPLNPDAMHAGVSMDREIHTRVLGESLTYPHWILTNQERSCSLFFGKTYEAVREWYDALPPDSGTHRILRGQDPVISNEVAVPEYSTDAETALELLLSRWTTPHAQRINGYSRSWAVEWLVQHGTFRCTLSEGLVTVGKGVGKSVAEAVCRALLAEADGI